MTKEIKLTKGFVALVDDEDFEFLNQWKWHWDNGYAVRTINYKKNGKWTATLITIHNQLFNNIPKKYDLDHINRNKLDNKKENLRKATRAQNVVNSSVRSDNILGYKGVCKTIGNRRKTRFYRARVGVNGKDIHLGYFNTPEEAAHVYDKKVKEIYGEFAQLNFPEDI